MTIHDPDTAQVRTGSPSGAAASRDRLPGAAPTRRVPTGTARALDRRRFLGLLGAAGAAGVVAGCRDRGGPAAAPTSAGAGGAGSTSAPAMSTAPAPTTSLAPTTASSAAAVGGASATSERVLVVVQLSGGNDGLNTLVPLDGRYHDLRPTIGLADDTLVAVPGTSAYGLHPALTPLAPLLAARQVAMLEAVGYPQPDRSHFAALDDWWSATPGRASSTGWLGRWLDLTAGEGDDPLRAVALGAAVPALVGTAARPAVVLSPATFTFREPRRGGDAAVRQLASIGTDVGLAGDYRAAVARASAAVDAFAAATATGPASAGPDGAGSGGTDTDGASLDGTGDGAGQITEALTTAARLVANHRPTRIVHIAAGGFDTHAGQLDTHQALLADLGTGLRRFFNDLTASGDANRVLLMTVSEFGRRAHENGSGGTDHGKAGVQFVVGPAVAGGVYGGADLARLDDGDLAPAIDVRSLYTNALDWLGTPAEAVLDRRYDTLGVLGR